MVSLHCVADGKIMPVADMRTNTEWSIAYVHVPKAFCPGPLRLDAQASSDRFIVGIGTPYGISAAAYYAAKTFPIRGLALTLAWAWFAVLIGVGAVAWRLAFRQGEALSAGFAGMGLFGLSAFFVYHFSPLCGMIVTSLFGVFVPLAAAAMYYWKPTAVQDFVRAHGSKFLLWLVIAWTYVALVSAIDNGGGSWSINGAFSPARWSSDNQLPLLFAEEMYEGTARDQIIWGPWLASDRPPLLSGLLLLVRVPLIGVFASLVNSEFATTLYMTISIVLLSSWVLAVYRFGEIIQAKAGSYMVAAAAMSPFFLFNSVYAWPKLLGASYALFVFLELAALPPGRSGRKVVILAGVCAALSILSHASNAMIFPIFGVLFARPILRQGLVTVGLSTAATVGVLMPWQLWQAYVQPHGNALLRFALSGDFGFADRTKAIMPDVIAAYRSLGFVGWIALKLDGLKIMLGSMLASVPLHEAASYGPSVGAVGNLRISDFFSVFRSMGIPGMGLLLLPVAWLNRSRMINRLIVPAVICGIGGIMLSFLVFLPPPIIHMLPYGAVVLILLSGASILCLWPALRMAALGAEMIYFLVVWVSHPLLSALRIEDFALLGVGAGLVVFVDLVWLTRGIPRGQLAVN
jgi:hypothetical protein